LFQQQQSSYTLQNFSYIRGQNWWVRYTGTRSWWIIDRYNI
jgi:hypothetical protein